MPEYPLFFEAGLLIVYARLGGPKGSCLTRLALDTGATTTMIPTKAALAIGSNPAHATRFREVITASGKELIPMIVVPKMKIFQKTLLRVTVVCHELPSESPIDGLLGLDILNKLNATTDIPNRSIRIL